MKSTSPISQLPANHTTTPSPPKSMGSTFCSTTDICGSGARGSRPSCTCATRSSTQFVTSSTAAASCWPIRRFSRPPRAKGTTTLFPVPYFDDATAYLTQSGQLYNEANAIALGRVYAFGPTFRAEKSKTRRHLTEFWMVEPEVAYATLDDVTALAEALVVSVVSRVLETRQRELATLERDTTTLERVQSPFPRLSYDDAAALLKEEGLPFEWGADFGSPDETALANRFDRPVIVHRFPAAIKAFHLKPDPDRPDLSLSVDVLAPEGYGEIVGGGQRLDDYELLSERIDSHDLPREAFEWYLDLRRYGSVPHSGFGMGLERVVTWVCGLEHVREAIPYPRMLYRLTP